MASNAKDQAQPQAAHEERIDPGACPPPVPAPGGGSLQDVQRTVEELQERLDDLERRGHGPSPGAPAGTYSDPDQPPGRVSLQEILPRIKDLARCVGGMMELAQIVTTLAQNKE
jgi:hypothetical protein